MYKKHLGCSHGLNFLLTPNISKLPSAKYANKHPFYENPKAILCSTLNWGSISHKCQRHDKSSHSLYTDIWTCSKDMTGWIFPV